MRKLITILLSVVIVCVLIASAPLLLGLYTKDKLLDTISEINRNQSIHVTLKEYHRQWFSSSATLYIDILDQRLLRGYQTVFAQDEPKTVTLALEAHVTHGPIFVRHDRAHTFYPSVGWAYLYGKLAAVDSTSSASSQHLPMLAKLGIKFRFSGHSQLVLHTLPNQYTQDGVRIAMQASDGKWQANHTLDHIQGEQTSQQITIQSGKLQLIFADKTHLKLDQQQTQYGFWVGSFDLQFPTLTLKSAVSPALIMQKFDMAHRAHVEKGLLDTQTKLNIDSITDGHAASIGPLRMQVDVQHVDAAILAQMATVSQKLNAAWLAKRTMTPSNSSEEANTAAMMQKRMQVVALQQKMLSLLPSLLAQGATFNLTQLGLTTPQGEIEASATIALPKQTDNQHPRLMPLLSQANAKLTLAIPKPLMQTIASYVTAAQMQSLAQQSQSAQSSPVLPGAELVARSQQIATELLARLVEQGVLVDSAKQYAFVLDYQQGTLQLNQKPMTLIELINTLTQSSAGALVSQPNPNDSTPVPAATKTQQQTP